MCSAGAESAPRGENMYSTKERLEYIDLAKAIGIVLVIIGHIVPTDTMCKRLLYAFHMPLFFILSGMLLQGIALCELGSWTALLTKRARRLLVPYLIWGMIYSTPTYKNAAFILYGSRETLLKAKSLTSLWFFPVMFIAVMLAQLIISAVISAAEKKEKLSRLVIIIIVPFAALLAFQLPHPLKYGLPLGLDVGIMASAFCLFGFAIKPLFERLRPLSLLLIAAVSLALLVRFYPLGISERYDFILMANGSYGEPLIFSVSALSGTLLTLCAARLTAFIPFPKGFLLLLGKSTLGILLVHKPIIDFMNILLGKAGFDISSAGAISLNTLFTLLLSLGLVLITEKIIPGLIGSANK